MYIFWNFFFFYGSVVFDEFFKKEKLRFYCFLINSIIEFIILNVIVEIF